MKRSNDFENNFGKKLRLDTDLDEFWGDDPDVDDIDDCIFRATQVCQKEVSVQQNTSVAPTYSAFKFNKPVSSTQARFNDSFALNRANDIIKDDDVGLEQKLRRLQTCFEAKEGEVSILRMKLKKTKETLEAENLKKQMELNEKLNVTQKEKEEAQTKLDMKNLEIANLKRKLLDVTKNAARDLLTQSFAKSKIVNSPAEAHIPKERNYRLEPSHKPLYPLKHIAHTLIFKPSTEDRLEIADIFKSNGLVGNITCTENSQASKRLTAHSNTQLADIFPDIGVVLNCNEHELELRDDCTGKLVIVSLQLLEEIWAYLAELEMKIKEDYLRRWDLEYLNNTEKELKSGGSFFDPLPWRPEECGIRCRQLLALLAEILPYSSYLRNYVMGGSLLYKHCDVMVKFSNSDGDFTILSRILEVIKKIGQMRKSSKFCGFLSAVCHLVSKIFQSDIHMDSKLCDKLYTITREVIFSRPSGLVLNYASRLLERASIHVPFIEKLCQRPKHNGLIRKSKKGIFLINKDCCTFQVFSILYKESICNARKLDVGQITVTLKFIYNTFNSKAVWLHYHENQHDDCLYEVCSLSLEVISAFLQQNDTGEHVKNALELSIKVLRLISFKYYDLLERKVDVYGQYKNVIMKLLEKCSEFPFSDYDVGALEKIMKTSMEDFQQTDKLNFKLPLYNDM